MKNNKQIVDMLAKKVMQKLSDTKRKSLVENITNKVVSKLKLNESLSDDDLACYLPPSKNNEEQKWAVLYDASYILENLEEVAAFAIEYRGVNHFQKHIIKAMIQLLPTGGYYGNCNNAWQVGAVAGPGYGGYIYQIGFALAPEGELTPDRKTVKIGARRNWRKQFDSGEREKNPLDNKEAPKTPPIEDDCVFHKDIMLVDPQTQAEFGRTMSVLKFGGDLPPARPVINPKTGEPEIENVDQLNYSYETKFSDKAITQKLVSNHEDTFNMISYMIKNQNILEYGEKAEALANKIFQAIESESIPFFRRHYNPASP